MKKKIFSFILAICLIIPCAFALSACGKNPPDEPTGLAGKTIHCSAFYDEFDFNRELYFSYKDTENGNIEYTASMTYEELLEFCLNTNAISYPNNAQPTTLVEAKELFVQKLENKFFDMAFNPHVTFAEDLSEVVLYYSEETPAVTYQVEEVKDGLQYDYIIKSDGEEIIRFEATDSGNDTFYVASQGDPHPLMFVKNWTTFTLDGECNKTIELSQIGNSENKITKPLDEVFGEDNEIVVTLLYTIKK